jgi:hypothetical protein
VISRRFVREISLLTGALFLLSASVNATLHRLEASPCQSELAFYSSNGHLQGLSKGDLIQLGAASAANPPTMLHRLRTTVEYRWL